MGTPAQDVHTGEAGHGEVGVVTRREAGLALSNSGGTAELADLISYAARIDIPLIAMTARGVSPLAEAASVALVLPVVEEGRPMGLAPTTSTTMRSEEHTSELQSLMRISYAVFCLKKKNTHKS